jgi:hypothetical protein
MERDPLVLNAPYELWREDGVLNLFLNRSAQIGLLEIKEILRIVSAMDPVSAHPVMVVSDTNATISNDARVLLMRSCKGKMKRTVAYVADSLSERISGDMFALLHRPSFPFKVFGSAREAAGWFNRSAANG